MSETPYAPPKAPKTITQVSDDQFLDFTSRFSWVLMGFVGAALGFFYKIPSLTSNIKLQGATGIIFFVIWSSIWIRYFSSTEKVDKQFLTLGFKIADKQGKHVMNKFEVPLEFLQKIVPLKTIHTKIVRDVLIAVIEFTENRWGVLIGLDPERIKDEDREAHEKRVEKVINGIPANEYFKTISMSKANPRNPLKHHLLEVASDSNGKKPTDQHLAGLYTKVAEDDSQVILWDYYAFQSLGKWNTVEEAWINYGAVIPGILKNMNKAKLRPHVIADPLQVLKVYAEMFSEIEE
jgi:hypothetical protein